MATWATSGRYLLRYRRGDLAHNGPGHLYIHQRPARPRPLSFLRKWLQPPQPARLRLLRTTNYRAPAGSAYTHSDLHAAWPGRIFAVHHARGGESRHALKRTNRIL